MRREESGQSAALPLVLKPLFGKELGSGVCALRPPSFSLQSL
jgi:hypothetical protein